MVEHSGEREFLPAALEILGVPLSPIRNGDDPADRGAGRGSAGRASFGKLGIVAMAQGKAPPIGQVKAVQPLETGRVVVVEVANGRRWDGSRGTVANHFVMA